MSVIPGSILTKRYFEQIEQRGANANGRADCAPRASRFKLKSRDKFGFDVELRRISKAAMRAVPKTHCGMILKVGGIVIPGQYWGYNPHTGTIGILHEARVYVGDVLEMHTTWKRKRR